MEARRGGTRTPRPEVGAPPPWTLYRALQPPWALQELLLTDTAPADRTRAAPTAGIASAASDSLGQTLFACALPRFHCAASLRLFCASAARPALITLRAAPRRNLCSPACRPRVLLYGVCSLRLGGTMDESPLHFIERWTRELRSAWRHWTSPETRARLRPLTPRSPPPSSAAYRGDRSRPGDRSRLTIQSSSGSTDRPGERPPGVRTRPLPKGAHEIPRRRPFARTLTLSSRE